MSGLFSTRVGAGESWVCDPPALVKAALPRNKAQAPPRTPGRHLGDTTCCTQWRADLHLMRTTPLCISSMSGRVTPWPTRHRAEQIAALTGGSGTQAALLSSHGHRYRRRGRGGGTLRAALLTSPPQQVRSTGQLINVVRNVLNSHIVYVSSFDV